MEQSLTTLMITAGSIGLVHTVLGPDHYLPFVALSKAKNWSRLKTLIITALCGVGHVLSSVVIGLIGVIFGVALGKIEWLESFRGDIAGWALLTFGLVYMVWGLRKAHLRHGHVHLFGKKHHHQHTEAEKEHNSTPWVIFLIFLFGPCEPLIPVLMYPAAQESYGIMMLVAGVFGVVTISTMLLSVTVLLTGISFVPVKKLERYAHALAGFTIFACGLAIKLGL